MLYNLFRELYTGNEVILGIQNPSKKDLRNFQKSKHFIKALIRPSYIKVSSEKLRMTEFRGIKFELKIVENAKNGQKSQIRGLF